jgi:hypothetical protein
MADIKPAADYFAPHLRVAIAKAMRQLRKRVSVQDIAHAIMTHRTQLVPTEEIKKALAPAVKVRRDAFRRGGQIGAAKVKPR